MRDIWKMDCNTLTIVRIVVLFHQVYYPEISCYIEDLDTHSTKFYTDFFCYNLDYSDCDICKFAK
jgi:hypothetical protein